MMTMDDELDRAERLLVEERAAITALDAERVEQLAAEKVDVFARLLERGAWTDATRLPRLQQITGALRRNLVLLAAARDCIRDGLAAAGVDVAGATGATLSVRG